MHTMHPHETIGARPLPRDARLADALMWKRRRWQAEEIMAGYWRDDLGPEYLDAEEDYHHAKEMHRRLVQDAWFDRLHERNVRGLLRLDETLVKIQNDLNALLGVKR
jgi:hypothetical protein